MVRKRIGMMRKKRKGERRKVEKRRIVGGYRVRGGESEEYERMQIYLKKNQLTILLASVGRLRLKLSI